MLPASDRPKFTVAAFQPVIGGMVASASAICMERLKLVVKASVGHTEKKSV